MDFDAILEGPALAGMRAYRQWVVYLVSPSKTKPGKLDKVPVHYLTGRPTGVNNPESWTDCATAVATARLWGAGAGVGFCFTAADPYVFIDLDGCLLADNTWSPLAQQVYAAFPGAAVEISASGRGLHLFVRGTVPAHSNKNADHHAEVYTADRFAALTGTALAGSCDTDHSAALQWLAAAYFPPRVGAAVPVAATGPRADWRGPTDDDELIRRALQSRSAAAAFGNRASFADLWTGNTEALARAYPSTSGDAFDRSSTDAALAAHLAWWSGSDPARMERLMRRSGLARAKHDREDYMQRTISNACAQQRDVLRDATPPAPQLNAAEETSTFHPILPDTPLNTARVFIEERYPGEALRCWQGSYYRWQSGAWSPATSADIHAAAYAFLEQRNLSFYPPNQTNVGKLLDALKAAAHLDSAVSPPAWLHTDGGPPPGELVACTNGLLHLPSLELLAPTPRLFNLNALPVAFDRTAAAPSAWLAFLAQVWPDDPEAIATLQELFGYLLTPDTSQQKIFLIVGPRRSGKGTLARVLTALLGSVNVASPTLGSMAESFGLQPLVGKLAAIVSDARLSGRTDQQAVAENLLRISGEDQINVPRKFLPDISVRLGIRFVLLTNELPRIADASGAMASRFVILKMAQSFLGREDPGLTSRLLPELPGIFAWAVQGWHKLRARGHFAPPQSSLAAAQELSDLGSPISAFVRDVCVIGQGAEVPVDDLYSAWCKWCAQQGMERSGTKPQFCRDLNAAQTGIRRRQPRVDGDRVPVYSGIGLRPGTGGTGWHGHNTIAGF